MSPPIDPPFGVWFISGLDIVPGEAGILVMLRNGRCVQFPTSVTPPLKHPIQRLWFTCSDAGTIRFRMKPDGNEWLRFIENTVQGWTMVSDDEHGRLEFPCRPANPGDLPDWYPEMLEKCLKKMDLLEHQER